MLISWAKCMDLDHRATSWHDCFDETRELLVLVGKEGRDRYLAKYHALSLIEVEEADWTDYFNNSKWFVQDYIMKKAMLFRSFRPNSIEDARHEQDNLALRLYGASDEDMLFAYATLGISRELADIRKDYARLFERGLYVCFSEDLPLMIPRERVRQSTILL